MCGALFPGFEHRPILALAGPRGPIAFAAGWHMPGHGTLNAVLVTDLRLWRRGRTLCDPRETYGTFAPFV